MDCIIRLILGVAWLHAKLTVVGAKKKAFSSLPEVLNPARLRSVTVDQPRLRMRPCNFGKGAFISDPAGTSRSRDSLYRDRVLFSGLSLSSL